MGSLRASPNQALLVGETKNAQARRKQKGKEKRNTEFEPKEEFDPAIEATGSKKDKHQRFDKGKCSYCKKRNHIEKYCMNKTIDYMSRLFEQHNISLPKGAQKDDSRDKTRDNERCHALKTVFSKYHSFRSLQSHGCLQRIIIFIITY